MMRQAFFALWFVLLASAAWAQDGAALYSQRCASCHENAAASRAPSRDTISALSADRIVEALEAGVMRIQGETLSPDERRAIATFLSVAPTTATSSSAGPRPCASPGVLTLNADTNWNGWGVSAANNRFQPKPGLTAAQVPNLKLKWAFGFEGDTAAATQPTIVGDRVFIGSNAGRVYAIGLRDGCVQWSFKADGGVRAAVTIVPALGGGASAIVADMRGIVYSLDAATGEVRWKRKVDDHRAVRISGTPVFRDGRLFVPVSSIEEGTGAGANYECCTFRGSVVALDAASGEVIWKTYMIADTPKPTTKNKAGTQLWGPSGAAVWSSPTVDTRANVIYVGTGDAYTQPAAPTTDAIVALDLATGVIKWSVQLLEGDAWNMACGTPDSTNCPENEGPDADFGQPPILATLPGGKRILAVGQKSAVVYGLDPDDRGRIVWKTKIGRGGMLGGAEWGSASDGTKVYVPLSDLGFQYVDGRRRGLDPTAGGGLFAIRLADGQHVWSTKPAACMEPCSPAQSAPASAMPGVVFSGSLDGHLRAYDTSDGKILWDYDTAKPVDTVNGVKASGGSIDVGGPAIANGMVLTTSGYPTWGGKGGNVLLAFGPQ
jgi:polyvinyl alcohol dehydrogenase (cytochrome)